MKLKIIRLKENKQKFQNVAQNNRKEGRKTEQKGEQK